MTATPKPDPFVSGTLTGGRLVLLRRSSTARCGVVMFTGSTLTDNSDGTFDFNSGGS